MHIICANFFAMINIHTKSDLVYSNSKVGLKTFTLNSGKK